MLGLSLLPKTHPSLCGVNTQTAAAETEMANL